MGKLHKSHFVQGQLIEKEDRIIEDQIFVRA